MKPKVMLSHLTLQCSQHCWRATFDIVKPNMLDAFEDRVGVVVEVTAECSASSILLAVLLVSPMLLAIP